MRTGRLGLVVIVGLCVVMALLVVFGLELSDTQAKSRSSVENQVHDRAVLAASLIDSLFNTTVTTQYCVQDPDYCTATVSGAYLAAKNTQSAGNVFAIMFANGQVLASTGVTEQALAQVKASKAMQLVQSGHPYGLGDYVPYGTSGVIEFAVSFSSPYGKRVLVTAFAPSVLSAFLTGELKSIPGVNGELNYLLDGNGVVLSSNSLSLPVGSIVTQPGATQAITHESVDTHGTYFSAVPLSNSTWRMVLASPDGPLFASVTGLHQLVPWLLFAGFALVALIALGLGWRVLRTSEQLRHVNDELASVNTELVGVNASLERRAAELARSNEELDRFASIASHDLQEPLRKVRTFTEQLSVIERDRLSDKGHDYLRRANLAAERMQSLIEDLLKFSRVSTQGRPFVPVDLDDIAQGVISDLDAQIASTGASVHLGQLPTISADPLQMRQLFQNLLSNALKFTRPGVTPDIEIAAAIDEDVVRLSVRDNGIGFEPKYSMRIFRVFERLHGRSDYPGTGIGLALCRKIADRHGGDIVADSEPNVGSTFTVTLPLSHFGDGTEQGVMDQHLQAHVDA